MSSPSVLILEPESSGLGLLNAAARLGLAIHVFDRRPLDTAPEPVVHAVSSGRAWYTQLETRNVETVCDSATELATRVDLRAVIPGFEYAVETAAKVAAKLGLRGLDPVAAAALRDKNLMKQTLAAAGVPVAAGFVVRDDQDIESATVWTGFPAVVKPVDGVGSVLVRRVDGPEQLSSHLALARHKPVEDMGKVLGRRLLVETYVAGLEFSVEGFVTGRDVVIAAVTEKHLGPEPHFVEVAHVVEADLGASDRTRLEHLAVRAVRALGITVGGFHLEARLGRSGPVVMEVGARLGGDRIPELVRLVHSWDLYDIILRTFSGMPVSERPTTQQDRLAAVRFFTASTAGRLRDPTQLEVQVSQVDGCEEVNMYVSAGARLETATDFRQRFGHAVIVAPDRDELESRFIQIEHLIRSAVDVGGT
jgi:biotin carboxylase